MLSIFFIVCSLKRGKLEESYEDYGTEEEIEAVGTSYFPIFPYIPHPSTDATTR